MHCPLTVDRAEAFREICPAGHGYTYSSSDIRLSMRKAEEEELARPSWEHVQKSHGTPPGPADRQPLRAATGTWLEAGTIPDKGIWAGENAWEGPPLGGGGYSTSKIPWVASISGGTGEGRLEQLSPWNLLSWPGWWEQPHLFLLPYGVEKYPYPRELLVEVGGISSIPLPQLIRPFHPLSPAMQPLGLVLAAKPEELAGGSWGIWGL